MKKRKSYSRRKFLGTASCAALGSATLLNGLLNLQMSSALAAPSYHLSFQPEEDYKALICILLAGGNDSYNMLVPTDAGPYNDYAATRSNQTLARESLLPIVADGLNESYGLHPAMPELKQLFDQGNLAFLANVGTLIEPIQNKVDVDSGVAKLPLGLFSHADQVQQWQTSIPSERSSIGWAGRMADILQASSNSSDISMNISLSGNNVFQAGNQSIEFTISPYGEGSSGIEGYNGPEVFNQIRTQAVKGLLEQQYQDVFKQTYADIIHDSQQNHELFKASISSVNLNTLFSPNFLSQSFQMIAKTIGARQALGMSRQTFFVVLPGFDNHDELLNNHQGLLRTLSLGMGELQQALNELNIADKVTTFTISDFARTLTSNGNGTDHAWGGISMMMGGAVKGRKMYGEYPSLALRSNLDVGGGVLVPKVSSDEYFAELALWFGVAPSDLPLVLPNIGNFYSPNPQTAPIGFLL